MNSYIARQPIFDKKMEVSGYELLYRDSGNGDRAVFEDGNKATSKLLSAAFTQFSLKKLTNYLPAYINFTDTLIMNDFTRMASPQDIVIEILEDTKVTDSLLEKVKELKSEGYKFALDDYTGLARFDSLLPLMDIVKVDFLLTDQYEQKEIVDKTKSYRNITMLAEKVETVEDYDRAKAYGYELFQGYFFAKPKTMHTKASTLGATTYGMVMKELNKPDGIDFNNISKIVHQDALMTFKVLQKVQTMQYYRGNSITGVAQALVHMGEDEVRRWMYLLIAHEGNIARSDELVREAYLRGVFAKHLMENCSVWDSSDNAFLVGMFSLLEDILGIPIENLLEEVTLPLEINMALLGKGDSFYSKLLEYVVTYESASVYGMLPDIGLKIDEEEVAHLYMNSLIETDNAYKF